MKLKRIESKTKRSTKPFISLNLKGVLNFSTNAAENVVKNNEHIQFFQDENNPESWYIHFAEDGLKIRRSKHQCMLNSKSIFLKIARSTRQEPESNFRAYIGKSFEHDGMELYPLLIEVGSHRY